jgi:hypothetical protein
MTELAPLIPCRYCSSTKIALSYVSQLISAQGDLFYRGVAICDNCTHTVESRYGVTVYHNTDNKLTSEQKALLEKDARLRWFRRNDYHNSFIEKNNYPTPREVLGIKETEANIRRVDVGNSITFDDPTEPKPTAIKHNFKIGDRVVAYGTSLNGKITEVKGEIVNIYPDTGYICIDTEYSTFVYHPKQLRKLVKKKPERFNVAETAEDCRSRRVIFNNPFAHVSIKIEKTTAHHREQFYRNIKKLINYLNKHWED